MIFKPKDHRIVKYAYIDEWIPLKCEKCGAVFVTKNEGPITHTPIHYGRDYDKAARCSLDGHSILLLQPSKKTYLEGNY